MAVLRSLRPKFRTLQVTKRTCLLVDHDRDSCCHECHDTVHVTHALSRKNVNPYTPTCSSRWGFTSVVDHGRQWRRGTYNNTQLLHQARRCGNRSQRRKEPTIAESSLDNVVRASTINKEMRVVEYLCNPMHVRRLVVFSWLSEESKKASIFVVLEVKLDVSETRDFGQDIDGWGETWETHRNFLFFALQSFAMRATFALHYSSALSNSLVTNKPGCCWTKETPLGAVVANVATVSVVDTVAICRL